MAHADYLSAVKRHVDQVLEHASDRYRDDPTPLLADFINWETGEPPKMQPVYGDDMVVSSDLSHQQNLLRAMVLLSRLSGDEAYAERAKAMFRYHFENLLLPTGLLKWGGHRYMDLLTLTDNGEKNKVHELKNDFPYYDLMFDVDREKAETFIKAFWNAHIYSWENFEMGRHGQENGKSLDDIWERPFREIEPFEPRIGLSFMNTGNDLMFSAMNLYKQTGDTGAVKWGTKMFDIYAMCRHKETKLGVYQFSQAMKRKETDDFTQTFSWFGDRARRQLGPELGEHALEANVILEQQANTIYGLNPQIVAYFFENGAPQGAHMLETVAENLRAFAKYAYIEETNMLRPLLADGQDLTGFIPARPGYYGNGSRFVQFEANGRFLLAYIKIALLAKDDVLWQTARKIAKGLGLGELGNMDGTGAALNLETACADGAAAMALLAAYDKLGGAYLDCAKAVADNVIKTGTKEGYFINMPVAAGYRHSADGFPIDSQDPLVVLAVEAAAQGKADLIPFAIY